MTIKELSQLTVARFPLTVYKTMIYVSEHQGISTDLLYPYLREDTRYTSVIHHAPDGLTIVGGNVAPSDLACGAFTFGGFHAFSYAHDAIDHLDSYIRKAAGNIRGGVYVAEFLIPKGAIIATDEKTGIICSSVITFKKWLF